MRHTGDLTVLANLLRGDAGTIIISGGANRVVRAAGALSLLHEATTGHHSCAGFSAGGLLAAAYQSQVVPQARDVLLELARGSFLKKHRLLPFLVTEMMVEQLMDLIYPLIRQESIQKWSGELLIGVTDRETGEGKMVSGKSNVMPALKATSAIPALAAPQQLLDKDGKPFWAVDGMCDMHFVGAMRQVPRKALRNVLVICNSRLPFQSGIVEDWLYHFFVHYYLWEETAPLRNATFRMEHTLAENLACIRKPRKQIKCLVLYADETDTHIWPWTNNAVRLNKAFEEWYDAFYKLMEEARPRTEI